VTYILFFTKEDTEIDISKKCIHDGIDRQGQVKP